MKTMLTMQEVFDKAVIGLLKQGKKSLTPEGACAYRGEGGAKCGAGILIDEEFYSEDLEKRTTATLKVANALHSSGVPVSTKQCNWNPELVSQIDNDPMDDFVFMIQRVHDQNFPEDWKDVFARLAEKYGLTMPEINGETA